MCNNGKIFRIGLCDDKKNMCEILQEMIHAYEEERQIEVRFTFYQSAKLLIDKADELDVLFLDIEMPEMDGIEAGRMLRNRGMEYGIIMLTACTDRFREAFKIQATDFLSKPIHKKDLFEALDDVRKQMLNERTCTVFKEGIPYEIPLKEILYLEANNSHSLIMTTHDDFRGEQSLTTWEKELDNRDFFRCHKAFIVNMAKINNISDSCITMEDGEIIPLSRRMRSSFQKAYMKFDIHRR